MRKTVLQLTSVALATLLATVIMLATDKTAPVQAAEKPNFVFVMTDDMPEKLMANMPVVRDRVAARGATFRNAYVSQSLCCPSRASFLTGQYPHNHGITGNTPKEGGNEIEFRSRGLDEETVAVWLDRAGYNTGLVGKYMNGYNDPYVPPGWDTWRALVDDRDPKTRTLSENGTLHDYPVAQWDVSTDLYRSKARIFLDKATDQAADPPFMLWVATNAPHLGERYADRHSDLFPNATIPRTDAFDEADVSDKPRWVRNLPRIDQAEARRLDELHRGQLRSLQAVDEMVGKMLDLLRSRGELDNTYVIFTTDNGNSMGQHRWRMLGNATGAKNVAYEEAAGIPFAVRGPGVPAAQIRKELVSNNDLAPTLAALGGAQAPAWVDGRSLEPVLGANPPTTWRTALLNERHVEAFLYEYNVPNYDAVISPPFTYVEWQSGEQEFYNRNQDPYQVGSDLLGANPDRLAKLRSRLEELKACSGDACRRAEGG
jgi:N-acetylglucosamine-6-sulfatase